MKAATKIRRQAIQILDIAASATEVTAYEWVAGWIGKPMKRAIKLAYAALEAVETIRPIYDRAGDALAAGLLRDGWSPGDPVEDLRPIRVETEAPAFDEQSDPLPPVVVEEESIVYRVVENTPDRLSFVIDDPTITVPTDAEIKAISAAIQDVIEALRSPNLGDPFDGIVHDEGLEPDIAAIIETAAEIFDGGQPDCETLAPGAESPT